MVVVEREFTLVGVNPALDSFADLAAEMNREAEHLAVQHATHLVSARGRSAASAAPVHRRLDAD